MREKQFQTTYTVFDETDTDVLFNLSESSEEEIFHRLSVLIGDSIRDGHYNGHLVHLYKRLCEQRAEHPPRDDPSDLRVYDLSMSHHDYSVLSDIIGDAISFTHRPAEVDEKRDLISVLESVTDQMVGWSNDDVLSDIPDPEIGELVELQYDEYIAVFENPQGDRWYMCRRCDTPYSKLSDDHTCIQHKEQ